MKKMKIFLIGGLGNNLFQLSYGEKLKEEGFNVQYNTFLKEKNIITSTLGWSIHPSDELDNLIVDESVSEKINIIDFLYLLIVFILKAANVVDFQTSCKNKLFWSRGIGYWQNNIPLSLKLLKNAKKEMINAEPVIDNLNIEGVLHVRRGDFQSSDQLSVEYYRKALNLFSDKRYTLVTDDKNIVEEFRNEFKGEYEFQLPVTKTLAQDLSIIANSKKLIMSNSTFCYWASQMGQVDTVIYPSQLAKSKEWYLELNNKNAIKVEAVFNKQNIK